MPFNLTITEEAAKQFGFLSARERRNLQSAIQSRLKDRPTRLSRAVKKLRPNSLAEFELRAGDLRALYNVEVEKNEVVLLIVGRKVGNTLVVGNEEFHGHQENPPKST
jgi:mRNA-degrading endonuclease RelE of RelBE toxin-antitoxin system